MGAALTLAARILEKPIALLDVVRRKVFNFSLSLYNLQARQSDRLKIEASSSIENYLNLEFDLNIHNC